MRTAPQRGVGAKLCAAGITGVAALIAGTGVAIADGQMCLAQLEAEVAQSYPTVPSMLPEELESLMRSDTAPLVIDVREPSEQTVSRIPGARTVTPDISIESFVARFAEAANGRPVVLYCSVGVRSSRLARNVREALTRQGALGVSNLRGGIFAWHNTGRALVAGGADHTDFVHPYSRRWSTYVEFRNYTRYMPAAR